MHRLHAVNSLSHWVFHLRVVQINATKWVTHTETDPAPISSSIFLLGKSPGHCFWLVHLVLLLIWNFWAVISPVSGLHHLVSLSARKGLQRLSSRYRWEKAAQDLLLDHEQQKRGATQQGRAWGWQAPGMWVGMWQGSFQAWEDFSGNRRAIQVPLDSSTGRNGDPNKWQLVLHSVRHLRIPLCPQYNRNFSPVETERLFWRFPSFLLRGWPKKWTQVSSDHSLPVTYSGKG